MAAGTDWGAVNDRSALVAIARLQAPAFAVVTAERWPAGYPLYRVVEEITTSRAHFDTLTNGRFASELDGSTTPLRPGFL